MSRIPPHGACAPTVYSEDECAERWHGSDLAAATEVLGDLMRDTGPEAQLLLIVTDADGVMLWLHGSGEALEAGATAGAHVGALWSEEGAGTNAMGTALVEGHPVQIFAAEHFNAMGDAWVCSAAPVCDPETGTRLGVVNLSGAMSTAHPHSLALAAAAARAVEDRLRGLAAERDARLRERWGSRVGEGRALALVAASGRVLVAGQPELTGLRLDVCDEQGTVDLGRRTAVAEPVPGGFLLWPKRRHGAEPERAAAAPRIEFLGRDQARLHVLDGPVVDLSRRHSEILVLLMTKRLGLTDEQLAFELYGERGKPVTARAEVSRLRHILGSRVTHAPYRLTEPPVADFGEVERLLGDGRLGLALARYPGPLLPRSEVACVVEARERLDYLLRAHVLASGDPKAVVAWMETPSGQEDIEACRVLAGLLEGSDPRRPAALSRLRRLSGAYGNG
jgi:hypothetical protein